MQMLDQNHGWQRLANLADRLEHFKRNGLTRAHHNAGQAVKSWIDANFAQGGALSPGGWPAPKNATAVSGRLMQKSSRLRQNWHITCQDDAVTVKAGVSYALAHHQGTDVLPARPLVPQGETLGKLVMPVYAQSLIDDLH